MDHDLEKFSKIIEAPGFLMPWLNRFYESHEIDLLQAIKCQWTPTETIARYLKQPPTPEKLKRSWKRGALDRNEDGDYKSANFHTRYEIWALFEGFKDLPDEIQQQLNEWELAYYFQSHGGDLAQVKNSGDPDTVSGAPRYLLLDEALEVLQEAEHIYLWPCNCRAMIQACNKPIYTCIRFENNRDIGFEISREKAGQIIRDANLKGLMQSGELGRDSTGKLTGAICNCCPDCCFPQLLAKAKNADKIWPFSRYVADYDEDPCTLCGLCSKRCPFGTFQFQNKTKTKYARLSFIAELCRGCGLCATGCPAGAIEMVKPILER